MKPINPEKNVSGDFDKFTNFMRRLIAVPHSEIKDQLDAEKEAKRTSKTSASPASPADPLPKASFERLPFPVHLASQFCIGQPFPCDLRHRQHKSICIIQGIFLRAR